MHCVSKVGCERPYTFYFEPLFINHWSFLQSKAKILTGPLFWFPFDSTETFECLRKSRNLTECSIQKPFAKVI